MHRRSGFDRVFTRFRSCTDHQGISPLTSVGYGRIRSSKLEISALEKISLNADQCEFSKYIDMSQYNIYIYTIYIPLYIHILYTSWLKTIAAPVLRSACRSGYSQCHFKAVVSPGCRLRMEKAPVLFNAGPPPH